MPGGRPPYPVGAMRRYPWGEWLDGEPHVLTVGAEIDEIARFRAALSRWTRKRGVRARTWRRGFGVVVVQAQMPEARPLGRAPAVSREA